MDEDITGGAAPTPGDQPEDKPTPDTPGDQKESDFDYGKEFDRVSSGSKYTPAEKAMHSARGIFKELSKHGIDPRTLIEEKQDEGGAEDKKPEGEKPLTMADVQRLIDEGVKKQSSALFDPILDGKIQPLVRSVNEAKLVKHWTNKFIAEGTPMDEAIEKGWLLANAHRFKQTFAEIVRGEAAESGKTDGQGSGQKKTVGKQAPTGKEADFAKQRGLVWDEGENKFISPARKAYLDKRKK